MLRVAPTLYQHDCPGESGMELKVVPSVLANARLISIAWVSAIVLFCEAEMSTFLAPMTVCLRDFNLKTICRLESVAQGTLGRAELRRIIAEQTRQNNGTKA